MPPAGGELSMTTTSPGRNAGASTCSTCLETFAVDRTVKDAGRIDAFAAQRRHEGRGFPVAMRNLGVKPPAAPAPSKDEETCWS